MLIVIAIKSGLQVNMFSTPGLLEEGLKRAREAEEKEGRVFVRDPVKTLEQGCSTTLVAALDPSIESVNGAYLRDGNVAKDPLPEFARGVENEEKLWRLSEELVGEKFGW